MTLIMPQLTDYQQRAFDFFGDGRGKILIIKAPRQVGKTFFNISELIYSASILKKSVSIIVEPSVFLARKVYNDITKALNGSGVIASANSTTCEINFINGSQIICRSIESMSRGLTVSGILIIDETCFIDDESIYTLLPLINANNAGLILTSSPFTAEGYFYNMYIKGMEDNDPNIKSFDWAKEEGIKKFLTEEKKALYRTVMSKNKYTTEILGEFLENDGLLFTNISACIGDAVPTEKTAYIGIDFATGSDGDYTVLTAINGKGQVFKQVAVNDLTPTKQVDWLVGIIENIKKGYTIRTILAEKNSIGAVYIDYMRKSLLKSNLTVQEFITTNDSKRRIIEQLQTAFEQAAITIPNDPVLINELKRFQATVNPTTKVVKYEGKNSNDDRVLSLAFAYEAYLRRLGNFTISFA